MSTAAATSNVTAAPPLRIASWRETYRSERADIRAAFFARPDTPALLRAHARLTDRIVTGVWQELGLDGDVALVAVGGYGRGQLFPHSDVDVLVLLPDDPVVACASDIERFITALWDVG